MSNSTYLKVHQWTKLDARQQERLLQRPQPEQIGERRQAVHQIIADVQRDGDAALLDYTEKFDGVRLAALEVDTATRQQAEQSLPDNLRQAMQRAAARIRGFHAHALPRPFTLETAPGVICQTQYRPIRRVGLYVPAGTAPLPSTMLMLGLPAQLAGCTELIVCSPPGRDGQADPAVLAAANLCGVTQVFAVGGAQAIAAMAYGTESIPRCGKLFGPGNRWVTEAKQQVSIDPLGAAIDMPAGPSEVLVLCDASANPIWVAADLLSQAEHGPDSQVLLVTTAADLPSAVEQALAQHLRQLPRADTARQALANSVAIVAEDLPQALAISNLYAPEHLILATDNADELVPQVQAAGSVFAGHYTPESLGDYCSGTNHVLPTAGWARSVGSLSTMDFMTRMTVQQATPQGLQQIGPDAVTLARHEQLDAHALAVTLRLDSLEAEAS